MGGFGVSPQFRWIWAEFWLDLGCFGAFQQVLPQ
jgi:hypothetical protein